ncbi:hypothetical protein PBY51_001359 [Eleginops maclovinus]|nr:hypothetical protein PBY51_001359 [Eleginops maclovinus]
MQATAGELAGVSNHSKGVQNTTNTSRLAGAALGGLGAIVGLAAAFLPGPGKLALCIAGGAAAVFGGASVVTANATKATTEIISREKVKELGKEFIQIIELQKGLLEDINTASEELEEKCFSLITKTRNQAKIGLWNTEGLQQLLIQTAKLSETSRAVVDGTLSVLSQVKELLDFIITLSRITPTAEEDAMLRNCITESALQCGKTVLECAKIRNMLRDYEEMQAE